MRVSTLSVVALAFGIAQASLPASSAKPVPSETEICYDDEPTGTVKPSSGVKPTSTVKPTGTAKPTGSWPPKLTTSTILSTKVYTVTKCPASVHNCPAAVTTEIVTVGTTVCPVTEDEPEWTTVPKPSYTYPGKPGNGGDVPEWTKPAAPVVTGKPDYVPSGTGSYPGKATSSNYPVTAGAGRAAQGVSAVAAVAGLVAYLL